jgi:hypothetical protein
MSVRRLDLTRPAEPDGHGWLTQRGVQQAVLVGRRLSKVPFGSVQHGPLPGRRKYTAGAVVGTRAPTPARVSEEITAAAGSGFGTWSGREDLNLDSFPGREACCNYTTSAKPASDEPDTFVV